MVNDHIFAFKMLSCRYPLCYVQQTVWSNEKPWPCSADHFHGFIKSKNWSTIYQKQYCRTTKVVFISLSDIFSSFSHFLQGTIRAGELLLFVQSLKTKSRHAFLSKICVYPILFVAWEVVRATCKGFMSDDTEGCL